jgi:hypothetical protein
VFGSNVDPLGEVFISEFPEALLTLAAAAEMLPAPVETPPLATPAVVVAGACVLTAAFACEYAVAAIIPVNRAVISVFCM